MIFNRELLLVILFQPDKPHGMLPANCLVENRMIRRKKHQSWNERLRNLSPRRAFFFCFMINSPSSASIVVIKLVWKGGVKKGTKDFSILRFE